MSFYLFCKTLWLWCLSVFHQSCPGLQTWDTGVSLGFSEIYIQLDCAWLQLASTPFPYFILARNRAWAAEAVNRTSRYRLLLALSLLSLAYILFVPVSPRQLLCFQVLNHFPEGKGKKKAMDQSACQFFPSEKIKAFLKAPSGELDISTFQWPRSTHTDTRKYLQRNLEEGHL